MAKTNRELDCERHLRSHIETILKLQTNTTMIEIRQLDHKSFSIQDDQGRWFKVEVSYVKND